MSEKDNTELINTLKQLTEETDLEKENAVKELEKDSKKNNKYLNKEEQKVSMQNHVAVKFKLVIHTIWAICLVLALVILIFLIKNNLSFQGILTAFIILLCFWLSTLGLEAIAEIIQLLEDIKNK